MLQFICIPVYTSEAADIIIQPSLPEVHPAARSPQDSAVQVRHPPPGFLFLTKMIQQALQSPLLHPFPFLCTDLGKVLTQPPCQLFIRHFSAAAAEELRSSQNTVIHTDDPCAVSFDRKSASHPPAPDTRL